MKRGKEFFFCPRIIRSPLGDCWGGEIETLGKAYPDEYLAAAAGHGFNGVWVHLRFRETVSSGLFPGTRKKATDALNALVEKTARHGIGVYCYLLEPRALPPDDLFWEKHPGLRGQAAEVLSRPSVSLCTSTPEVREYLEESSFNLFRLVPGMAGAFLITASEFPTHCYSHYPLPRAVFSEPEMAKWAARPFTCPRCAGRARHEVAAEAVNLVFRGIRRASPGAEVIAWTWSWYILEPDPQRQLIGLLEPGVTLMSDFERGGRKRAAGRLYPLDEYSLSYIGPSPRFRRHLAAARENGLKVMAKIQVSNTHEIASVPHIPVPYLLAEKMKRMREAGVDGYLGCWIMGGNISPMSRVAGLMSRAPALSPAAAVARVASEEFGTHAAAVRRAWRKFSDAWRKYPFSIPFIYYGPINYATACPLRLDAPEEPPTPGWLALPRDEEGTLRIGRSSGTWFHPLGGETIVAAFGELLEAWREGLAILEAEASADPADEGLAREAALARHIMLSIVSTVNITRFYMLLEKREKSGSAREKTGTLREIARIMRDEISNANADRVLVEKFPELGWHAEAHEHLYTAEDLDRKIEILERELARPEFRFLAGRKRRKNNHPGPNPLPGRKKA